MKSFELKPLGFVIKKSDTIVALKKITIPGNIYR